MTEEQNVDMMGDGISMTWSETWIKALTQPSVDTFEQIAADPGGSTNKAYLWIAISSAISFFGSFFVNGLFGAAGGDGIGGAFFGLICGVVIAPIIVVIGFMIMTGISQGIAGLLSGTGSFSKLAYAYAAYYAPLTLISTGLSVVPYLGLLAIPLGFYGIVLNVIAIKAVNQFSWGKAVASSFAILAVIFMVVAICLIVGLVLLGPAIEEIFSGIMSELQ